MSNDILEDLSDDLENEDDIALRPSEVADPRSVVESRIPRDILDLYEVHSYRNAAVILSETRPAEFAELLNALRSLKITKTMMRMPGGNESAVPKMVSGLLRPHGWHETIVQGDLLVKLRWKEPTGRINKQGKQTFEAREHETLREKFLDGHKIDYVKGKVAFDLEWNSKDQTFDRDLYALSAFSLCGVIDAGVLVTRGISLNPMIKTLGQALNKEGKPEFKESGAPRMTHEKYGASTTWMGKLLYRLNAGRNGSCPVLAFGITPKCISD